MIKKFVFEIVCLFLLFIIAILNDKVELYLHKGREVINLKYTVGLQKRNTENYICSIIENKSSIYEVYFSWGDFPNGRSNQLLDECYTPWELQDEQRETLSRLSAEGIAFNLLLNANCYGKESQSRAFFNKIGMTIDYILEKYGLQSVTTTSPLIAKFIRNNFEQLEVRASVNMEIGTIQGMDYVKGYFDSYYIQRECNRDLDKIKELHTWSRNHGKKIFMLANSGCMNYCSAHNFHDNLVAHESEIAKMDNAYEFHGICHEYLKAEENYSHLITDTNFVRPEDIYKYEPYVTAVKLATRVHRNPESILQAYTREHYSGNILNLLEPSIIFIHML